MVKNFDRSLLESSQGWHCASSACIWERKANLEVFAEELKIFMHTHMLSAGPCTWDKQTEWAWLLQTLFWRKV